MPPKWANWLEKLFLIHEISPDKQRRGRLIVQLIIITVFLMVVITLVNLGGWLIYSSSLDRTYCFIDLLVFGFLYGIWFLNRRGHTSLAGYLLLILYLVGICTISSPKNFVNAFWAFSLPIIMASFIHRPFYSFPTAVISIGLYLLICWSSNTLETIDVILFKSSGFFALALLSYLTASYLDKAIETVNKSEEKYRDLFNDLPVGLYRTSPDGRILDANPAFYNLFGFPENQYLRNVNASDLYADPSSRDQYLSYIDRGIMSVEIQMQRLDGTTFWATDHVQPIRNARGEVMYYEGSLIDITKSKQAEQDLERFATIDALTGLYNRRYFFIQADQLYVRSNQPPFELAILMIDVDHFKKVNDNYGHAAGDTVLSEIASRIHEGLRATDVMGRYGGDEFAILLPRTNNKETYKIAERLRKTVAGETVEVGEEKISVTISIGVATLDKKLTSLDTLLQRADQALYSAKHSGRNRWIAWQPSLTTRN